MTMRDTKTNRQTAAFKTQHRKLDWATPTPPKKNRDWCWVLWKCSRFFSTCDTRRVTHVTSKPVSVEYSSSHSGKRERDCCYFNWNIYVVTWKINIPWRSPKCDGVRKIVELLILSSPIGTLCLKASLLEATLYQGNHARKYKFWNIASLWDV